MVVFLSILMLLSVDSIPNSNATINVNLAHQLASKDQWVFLMQLDDNELFPLDSSFINAGERAFMLKAHIYKKDSRCGIIFSENGPPWTTFYINPGDNIIMDIVSDGIIQPARGSLTVEMEYARHTARLETRRRIVELESILSDMPDREVAGRAELQKELEQLYYDFNVGINLKHLKKTQSPSNYRSILSSSFREQISDEQFEELVAEMKRKFPDDIRVQMYPDHPQVDPPSERSRYWLRRRAEIFDKSVGITRPTVEVEKFNGVDFGDLTLPDTTGNEVSLSDISTPYIFVDFWASWCVPCRREVPHIKAALDKYRDEFTVYAVSLDEDRQAWIEAIAKDGSEELVHVLMGVDNDKAMAIRQKYGITSIPANFLIDSDFKIIATNLRGEQLEEKLKELTE